MRNFVLQVFERPSRKTLFNLAVLGFPFGYLCLSHDTWRCLFGVSQVFIDSASGVAFRRCV